MVRYALVVTVVVSVMTMVEATGTDYLIVKSAWMGKFFMPPFLMVMTRLKPYLHTRAIEKIVSEHNVNITYRAMHDDCGTEGSLQNFMYIQDWAAAESKDLILWVGPCQEGTEMIASITSLYKVAEITATGSKDAILSNKGRYPFFNRLVTPASSSYGSVCKFMDALSWDTTSLFVEDSQKERDNSLVFKQVLSEYTFSVNAEVVAFIDQGASDEEEGRLAEFEAFITAAALLSDPDFHDSRVITMIIAGHEKTMFDLLEQEHVIPYAQGFITLAPYAVIDTLGPNMYVINEKAADTSVWDELCEPIMNDYYDWYEKHQGDWYYAFPSATYLVDNYGAAWSHGFTNRSYIQGQDQPYTCESVHMYKPQLAVDIDDALYALRGLDMMLNAGENPLDAAAWQPFLREQPEYHGLTGPFTVNIDGDRVSTAEFCFVPGGGSMSSLTCCLESSAQNVSSTASPCEFILENEAVTDIPPMSTLPPKKALPPTIGRIGGSALSYVYFSATGLRNLPLLSMTLIFEQNGMVYSSLRITDTDVLASGEVAPSSLAVGTYSLTLISETAAGYSEPSEIVEYEYVMTYTSCTDYQCLGSYGVCNPSTGICSCPEGTVLAAMVGLEGDDVSSLLQDAFELNGNQVLDSWKTCILDIASKREQREFWTLSLWLSAWGLLASGLMIWEFAFNEQLRYPNTMMQCFIAFAVPDCVLSLVNFIVFTVQLVYGDSLGNAAGVGGIDESGCIVVAFIVYFVVIATYMAPVIVSACTYMKFHRIA